MSDSFEGVEQNTFCRSFFNLTNYSKIPIQAKKAYYLVLESYMPFTY